MGNFEVLRGGKDLSTEEPSGQRVPNRRLFKRDEIYRSLIGFLPSTDQAMDVLFHAVGGKAMGEMLDDEQAVDALAAAWVSLMMPMLDLLATNPEMVLKAMPHYVEQARIDDDEATTCLRLV